MSDIYFDGDPSTESARRHLERVLNEPKRGRRWPWVAAAVAGAAAWYFWPRAKDESNGAQEPGDVSPGRRSPHRAAEDHSEKKDAPAAGASS